MTKSFKSGMVALAGRPNVGKSTLLNALIGEKVSIVSPKPQTTRNRIVGIKNLPGSQIIFVDTPGIHKPQHKLGELIVAKACESVKEVDLILFMAEPEKPGKGDNFILDMVRTLNKDVFLLINKIDNVKKPELLPVIEAYTELYDFTEIIPVSAKTGDGTDILLERIVERLPEGPKYYPDDIVTDQIERFMVAEIVREKVMQKTGDEIPYSVAVEVISWTEKKEDVILIDANIYVERDGQKGIIIGKSGRKLKEIGTAARFEAERLLGCKLFLKLWVKVKKDWRGDERALKDLGYN
ncbi:MAG: GTPase Era [Nitrospirae bacterium]|nr:MAG: GTPase Era [Nitrospirota bacterium]